MLGVPTHVVSCDIRDRGSVDEAFAVAVATLGPVHGLVAASGLGGPNGDGADDRFDELVQVNLNGTYYRCRAAVKQLAPGPEARHLVIISSILGRIAVPAYTGYSASKAGLLGLVRSLAAELGPDNVQMNAICPGWVDTEMAWSGLEGLGEAIGARARTPIARPCGPCRSAACPSRTTSPARSPGCSRRTHAASRDRASTRTAAPGWASARAARRRGAPRGAPQTSNAPPGYRSAGMPNCLRCCSSSRSSSSSVPMRTGPLNQFFADKTHQPPKTMPMAANQTTV